jgi:transposase
MVHVAGESRFQRLLMAPSLDEIVGSEHPVRVIDAFIDGLNLKSLGFAKVDAEATGRPPYHPGDLLKLYVYGYINQMRSSRRLEREAERNIEVQWLVNRVAPAFKTIADFRKDHAEAIVEVCRAFVLFCRDQSLYGAELVAIDGTKIEAVASRKKAVTAKRLQKQLTELDAKIGDYLAEMDEADRQESAGEARPAKMALLIAALRRKREEIQAQTKELAQEGLSQKVIGEPDARLMKTARHGHQVAYNAQSVVDAEHGLIAAFELTNDCNDQCQLAPMAEAGKAALQVKTLTAVADTGYSNGEQGERCAAAGITAVVPRQKTVNTNDAEFFSRDAFTYDAQADSFTCPAGEKLKRSYISHSEQKTYYTTKACGACALKGQCTDAQRRKIVRHFYEDARETMHRRATGHPIFMKRRRELVEHPFGTMKWMLGYPRFLLRGLKKAKAELALAVLGFNIKRSITIKGVPALLQSLREKPA